MIIELGNEALQMPRLQTAGIFEGKITKVEVVDKNQNGEPLQTNYVGVQIDTAGGYHYDKFFITTAAGKRIKELATHVLQEEIGSSIEDSTLQRMVGVNVAFKLVPDINAGTGKVYYKMPFADFIRVANMKDTLTFKPNELKLIEEAKNIKATVNEAASETKTDDLPF